MFFTILIRRSKLALDETESKTLATYLALASLLLFLFFLRTNTIVFDKIPYWEKITFPDRKETTSLTTTTTKFSVKKPDVVEIILDSSGSMADPTQEDFIKYFVKNKTAYQQCLEQLNEKQTDTDKDYLPDCIEEVIGSDPNNKDTDGNGQEDGKQLAEFTDPSSGKHYEVLSKLDHAKNALNKIIDNLPSDLQVGLRIYSGNISEKMGQKVSSCDDIQLVVPIQKVDKQALKQHIDTMEAKGSTPLAKSLQLAEKDFTTNETLQQTVILVTDGIESCEGDPCAVAKDIHSRGRIQAIDVLGIDIGEEVENSVACIAENGGGQYYSITSIQDFENSFKEVIGIKSFTDRLREFFQAIPWWVYLLIVGGGYLAYQYLKPRSSSTQTFANKVPRLNLQLKSNNFFQPLILLLKGHKKEVALLLGLLIWWWLKLPWFLLVILILPILWYAFIAKQPTKEKLREKTKEIKKTGKQKAGKLGEKLIEFSKKK